jgi:Fur family ferric uptake transcriptional regulator
MENPIDKFAKYLKKNNLRFTKTRRIVAESILKINKHFNAELLYEEIKKRDKSVSLATVYRTMPLLIKAGLSKQSFRCSSKDNYETTYNEEKHLHMICRICHKIIEVNSEICMKKLQEMAADNDFTLKNVNITLNGICGDCETKLKEKQ